MSRHSSRSGAPPDLTPYSGCPADAALGYTPLAVGWLRGGADFPSGAVPSGFAAKLAPFCRPEVTVCRTRAARQCPLCRHAVEPYGAGEIRVIGDDEIYAAPDLVAHYVETHGYQPPDEFVDAVLRGPGPDSQEHRALRRALQEL